MLSFMAHLAVWPMVPRLKKTAVIAVTVWCALTWAFVATYDGRAGISPFPKAYDRQHHLALPHCGEDWRRGDGCGVQGRRHRIGTLCGVEVPARRSGAKAECVGTVSPGSASSVGAESSQYLHHLRNWRRSGTA